MTLVLLALLGCHPGATSDAGHKPDTADTGDSDDTAGGTDTAAPIDPDGDGYDATTDCDNGNAAIHPGAPEVCNGWDDDCDRLTDDADPDLLDPVTSYRDADQDGYGDPTTVTTGCVLASGRVAASGDCLDDDPSVHPGQTETCDGVDQDCDGVADDACTTAPTGALTPADATLTLLGACYAYDPPAAVFADQNGDGLPDLLLTDEACGAPTLRVLYAPFPAVTDLALPDLLVPLPPEDATPTTSHVEVAGGADLDGDGADDWVLVVADSSTGGESSVRVYAGPVRGEGDAPATSLVVRSPEGQGQLESTHATVVRGDPGVVLVPTAYRASRGTPEGARTYVLPGDSTGDVDSADLGYLLAADTADDGAPDEVYAVGDVDGDGLDDVVRVHAAVVDLYTGPLSGGASPMAPTLSLGGETGSRVDVAAGGDVDGDGRADVLVAGQWAYGGEARHGVRRTLRAEDGTLALDPGAPLLEGPFPGDYEVLQLVPLDTNGDGAVDLATSDPYAASADGVTCLAYGPFSGTRDLCADGAVLTGDDETRYLGDSLLAADENGDGRDDLLVFGRPGFDQEPAGFFFLGGE